MNAPIRSRYRGLVRLTGAELINSLGTGIYYPFALIFFHQLTGRSYALVGGVLGICTLVVLPMLGPVGQLADRLGSRWVVAGSCGVRVVGFFAVSLWPNLATFVVCALLSALGNRTEQACGPALVASLSADSTRSRYLGVWRTAFNLGLGLGSLVGSLLLGHPGAIAAIGLINAASFVIALGLIMSLPAAPLLEEPSAVSGAALRSWEGIDRRFVALVVVDALLWVNAVGVETSLAPYVVDTLGSPGWIAGAALAAATAVTAVGQLPVSLFLEKRSLGCWLAVGSALHLTMPVVLLVVGSVGPGPAAPMMIGGLVVVAAGEVLATQALTLVMLEVAPAAERGRHFAFRQQVVGVGVAVTPVLVGVSLDLSATLLWWLFGGLAIAATLIALRLVRSLREPAARSAAATEHVSTERQ